MVRRMIASIDKANRRVHRVLLAADSCFDILTSPASATSDLTSVFAYVDVKQLCGGSILMLPTATLCAFFRQRSCLLFFARKHAL